VGVISVILSAVQLYGQELTGDVDLDVDILFRLVKTLVLSDHQAYPIDPIIPIYNGKNI
jgi:hypothetical protein